MARREAGPGLAGFERDLHELLDDFVALVVDGGVEPSFSTFKTLWQERHASFIHQAYPGCDSSPDYVQLLFATALDRLDHPSPLPPRRDGGGAGARALVVAEPAAGGELAEPASPPLPLDPQLPQPQQQPQQEGEGQPRQEEGEARQQQPAAAPRPAPFSPGLLSLPPPPSPLVSPGGATGGFLDDLLWLLDEPPAGAGNGGGAGPHAGNAVVQPRPPPPPQQQQQQRQQQQQQQQQQPLPGGGSLPPGSPRAMGLWEVLEGMWPGEAPLEGGGGGGDGGDGAGGSEGARASGGLGAPTTERAQDAQRRASSVAEPGKGNSGSGAVAAQQREPAASGGPPPQPPPPPRPEEDEEWLFRDEARQGADGEAEAAAAAARAAREEVALTAGVLYCLHCLHQTQHLSPKAAVYAPLPLLQLLSDRLPALAPAGAGDAAVALRALLRSGAVVAGAARRPAPRVALGAGEPPGGRGGRHGGGGGGGGVPPWAVAPDVQRAAIFHVKAALKGLANFQRLQSLCDTYAAARAAVFGPLGMRTADGEGQPRAAGAAPAGPGGTAAALVLPSWAAGSSGLGRGQLGHTQPQEQQQGQQGQTQGAGPTDGLSEELRPAAEEQQPIELFDSRFGSALQGLAVAEAAALLGALRPARPAGRAARRRRRAQDAGGDEDAPAAQRPRLGDDAVGGPRVLTGMAARLYGPSAGAPQPAPSASGAGAASEGATTMRGRGRERQQRQGQPQGQARGPQGRRQPAGAAGPQPPLHAADLAAVGLAPLAAAPAAAAGGPLELAGGRGVALALAAREERQQRAVLCADSWFAAHDRLMSGRPVALEGGAGPPHEEGRQQPQQQRRRAGAEGAPPPVAARSAGGRSAAPRGRGGRDAGQRGGRAARGQ
ncbi:DNA excision repair protein [Raphidocelis subcapitata]|uniref:DNA excision repair protein n=1 Tax=Raphidocelis subcapitata TaxID=307507 RepID=A0A2V0PJR1_9CHLO|nr:DNA excision repair protein [Raphidocelis subcapitata]|eukprot:GBG00039.1 DNA excision repair protein [Raphidocelis subcapitata]